MAKNLEVKARYEDLRHAANVARDAGGTFAGTLMQVDTYFHAPNGRLKLRENQIISPIPEREPTVATELIAYQRPDEIGMRWSRYHVTAIRAVDTDACLAGLSAVLGVRVVVRKKRELWHVGATRIHLDAVLDLGNFVELETVMTTQSEEEARREHERLVHVLGISKETALAGSYSELLMSASIQPVYVPVPVHLPEEGPEKKIG